MSRTVLCDCMMGPNDPDPACDVCHGSGDPLRPDYDVQVLEGAAKLFDELATGANPAPLALAQGIRRVADALRAAGGLHNPEDAPTLAAVALSAMPLEDMAFIWAPRGGNPNAVAERLLEADAYNKKHGVRDPLHTEAAVEIKRLQKERDYAVIWANRSVDQVKEGIGQIEYERDVWKSKAEMYRKLGLSADTARLEERAACAAIAEGAMGVPARQNIAASIRARSNPHPTP